jgi:hypothetical protein
MYSEIPPSVWLAVIAVSIAVSAILLVRRNASKLALKGNEDVLLNLAVSPVLPEIKNKSNVSTPIREVAVLNSSLIGRLADRGYLCISCFK